MFFHELNIQISDFSAILEKTYEKKKDIEYVHVLRLTDDEHKDDKKRILNYGNLTIFSIRRLKHNFFFA